MFEINQKFIFTWITLIFFITPGVSYSLTVPLEVKERAGVNRINEPVTYGIPIAEREDITSTSQLGIEGQDAQFRILSRYNGSPSDTSKPIRVVLADFQATLNANQTRTYNFTNSGSGTVFGNNLGTLDSGAAIIDTGKLKAVIKNSDTAILSEVWIDKDSNGSYDSSEKIIDNPVGDGFIVNYNGTPYLSGNTRTVTIEENGPMRCVVKINGDFNGLIPPHADNEVSYTIRINAYKGKSHLKVDTTLENENKGWTYLSSDPIHNIYITNAYVKTTLNSLGSKTVQFGSDYTVNNYNSLNELKLLQQEISSGTQPKYAWKYEVTNAGSSVASGSQFNSFVDVTNSSMGMMVSSKWFWQNHPKAVRVSGDVVYFDLFPDVSTDYRILGGIWKTHTMIYYFHDTDNVFTDELASIKKRLVAKCSDAYYADADFLFSLAPGSFSTGYTFPAGEPLQSAIDEHADSHRALFDTNYIDNYTYMGDTILNRRAGRRTRLDSNTHATWYGWLEFGAMPRSKGYGYSSQHYDWSYLALMGFMRFSDYNMLDLGEELISHKADIIAIHDPTVSLSEGIDYEYHGGQRYEADGLFSYNMSYGVYNAAPRSSSHKWTKAMTLQYLLTGEERYKDAAVSSYEHSIRVKDSGSSTNIETRNQSRAIDALVNGYRLTGNAHYVNEGFYIFEKHLLDKEGRDGNPVGWIHSSAINTDGVWLHYDTIMVEPLIKLHISLKQTGNTTDADKLMAFLQRWGDFVKTKMYPSWGSNTVGTYRYHNTEYFPYTVATGWDANLQNWGSGTHPDAQYSLCYADLFAHLYNETGNISHLNLARNIYKDYHMYRTSHGFQPIKLSIQTDGLWVGEPGSADWKIAKAITKPMYYVKTEWEANGKPGLPKLPSTPTLEAPYLYVVPHYP